MVAQAENDEDDDVDEGLVEGRRAMASPHPFDGFDHLDGAAHEIDEHGGTPLPDGEDEEVSYQGRKEKERLPAERRPASSFLSTPMSDAQGSLATSFPSFFVALMPCASIFSRYVVACTSVSPKN